MSKHRAERRPRVSSVALALIGLVPFAIVGSFLMLWPTPAPSAASQEIRAAEPRPSTPPALRGLRSLVVYGHSMPAGGGASDVALAYPQLVAEATGLRLLDRSEGGTIASTTANTMAASPAVGAHDVVVIHTGLNDIFRRGDDAVTLGREAIERLLSGTGDAGRRVLVLECQPSSWEDTPPGVDLQAAYDAWNAMLFEEAGIWPGVEVLETCATWDPAGYTDPGKYHPNDDGHALIAQELTALLLRG